MLIKTTQRGVKMAIYLCDGNVVQAKNANELFARRNEETREVKTIWRGKLSEMVEAVVEEFGSIETYARIARSWLNAPVYDGNLLEEGLQLTRGIRRNLERIEELLEGLTLISEKYKGGEFNIDDREV
jgi:hypothetical protein